MMANIAFAFSVDANASGCWVHLLDVTWLEIHAWLACVQEGPQTAALGE